VPVASPTRLVRRCKLPPTRRKHDCLLAVVLLLPVEPGANHRRHGLPQVMRRLQPLIPQLPLPLPLPLPPGLVVRVERSVFFLRSRPPRDVLAVSVLDVVLLVLLVLVLTAMVLNAVVTRRTRMRTKSYPSRAPSTVGVCLWTMSTLVMILPLHVHRVGQLCPVPSSTLTGRPSLLPHKRALPTYSAQHAAALPKQAATAVPRMRVPRQQQARNCPMHSRSRPCARRLLGMAPENPRRHRQARYPNRRCRRLLAVAGGVAAGAAVEAVAAGVAVEAVAGLLAVEDAADLGAADLGAVEVAAGLGVMEVAAGLGTVEAAAGLGLTVEVATGLRAVEAMKVMMRTCQMPTSSVTTAILHKMAVCVDREGRKACSWRT